MRYRFGDLEIDLERHQVMRDATPVKLTPLGFRVLQTLVEAAPSPLSGGDTRSSRADDGKVLMYSVLFTFE